MKIQKISLFLFLLVFLLGSCKKTELNNDNQEVVTINNQFDYIGVAHNIGLQHALSAKKSTKSLSIPILFSDVVEGLEAAGIEEQWPSVSFVESVWAPIENHIVTDSNYSIGIMALDLYQQGKINAIQLDWFMQLSDVVEQNFGKEWYASSIENFESLLINSNNLNIYDCEIILLASSVALHSGEFWAEKATGLKNTQYKWWQWGLIVGADVAGAVVGAGGGPGGSISAGACCSAGAMYLCEE